jgi:hypothetical protein
VGRLLDVEQDKKERDDAAYARSGATVMAKPGSRSCFSAFRASDGNARNRIGSDEGASPTVAASAAHFGPSSAIAHDDPKRVVPKTSAMASRSRNY